MFGINYRNVEILYVIEIKFFALNEQLCFMCVIITPMQTPQKDRRTRERKQSISIQRNHQITMKVRAKDVTKTIKKPIKWGKNSKMRTVSLHL